MTPYNGDISTPQYAPLFWEMPPISLPDNSHTLPDDAQKGPDDLARKQRTEDAAPTLQISESELTTEEKIPMQVGEIVLESL
jgi:hypothetical protein